VKTRGSNAFSKILSSRAQRQFPLYKELGDLADPRFRRIALVYGSGEFLVRDAEFFRKGLSSGKLVYDEMLPSASDYRAVVNKLLGTNPDAISFFVNLEEGLKFLKSFRELRGSRGIRLICDANVEMYISDYVSAFGPELFEGCIATALPNRMSDSFKAAFERRFGEKPRLFADYAFDAASILRTVIGSPQEHRASEIQGLSLDGASGGIRFDESGTRLSDFEVHIFRGGRFEKLSR
jgi:ABC-type branched-subunit amino acid transport system substrate-binding protein